MQPKENRETKYQWKREYTVVLILNTCYILFFGYLMQANI